MPLGLHHLAEVKSLKILELYGTLHSNDIQRLSQVTQLQALRIGSFYLDSEVLEKASLKTLINLEELDTWNTFSPGTDLDIILSMPKLRSLRFETLPAIPHPMHQVANDPNLPQALKADFATALQALETQARDSARKDYPITLSIGRRILLSPDWEQGPGVD